MRWTSLVSPFLQQTMQKKTVENGSREHINFQQKKSEKCQNWALHCRSQAKSSLAAEIFLMQLISTFLN